MLGLRDYVEKNGFPGVTLGLSGGIDSALVAAIAADAVGLKSPRGDDAVTLPVGKASMTLLIWRLAMAFRLTRSILALPAWALNTR